jgi:4-amino-4-deoxy-L-arabinose transferase-like glycosyltransferase
VKPGLRRLFLALIAVALLFRLAALFIWNHGPVFDEQSHLSVTREFGPGLPSLSTLADYNSAAGPAFYVIFGNLGHVLGYNLLGLRLVVFAFALGCIVVVFRLCRLARLEPLPAAVLLCTAPYFFTLSGLFMTELPALFFALLALLGWLLFRRGRTIGLPLALAAAALAILCRQYFIFLPVALAAADVIPRSQTTRNRLFPLVWLSPLLTLVPLVLLWHGLVPPALAERYHAGFALGNVASVLAWTGLWLLPWALARFRIWHLVALAAVPFAITAPGLGNGITSTLLRVLPGPLPVIAVTLLAFAGLLLYLRIAAGAHLLSSVQVPALVGALLFCIVLIFGGPTVYERYLLPGYVFLLLLLPLDRRPLLALVWAGLFQLPLAVYHLLHFVTS